MTKQRTAEENVRRNRKTGIKRKDPLHLRRKKAVVWKFTYLGNIMGTLKTENYLEPECRHRL